MSKLRALIVDDSAAMRRILTEVLLRDPQIEVAATAVNGRFALDKLEQIKPDFVTLDVEMPVLDGLQTLRELRRRDPRLPVIMLSLLTRRGAGATLDALAAGANDYVTKPGDSASLEESILRLAADLLPKVHALCPGASPVASPVTAAPLLRLVRPTGRPVELVCIATSTGGPNALQDLFAGFTAPLPVPVAIVQHMPPTFTRSLAERLDGLGGPLRCHEAQDGDLLLPGHAYLAPGGFHLAVGREVGGRFVARITSTAPENSCRPAADVLFRTAAATGAGLLGVVMTGMGQDGLRGCEHIQEHGGQVIAQDRETSVVWGMPGAVATAGLAHAILPLARLAPEIMRCVGAGRLVLS